MIVDSLRITTGALGVHKAPPATSPSSPAAATLAVGQQSAPSTEAAAPAVFTLQHALQRSGCTGGPEARLPPPPFCSAAAAEVVLYPSGVQAAGC